MPGQPALGVASKAIGIDATALDVIDSGLASTRILEASLPFDVQTSFELGGLLAAWLVSLSIPFKATYYAESFGPGFEGEIASASGTTVAGKLVYASETKATVPANTLTAGTYKLTVVVSFGGASPVPITAFYEGEVIQIF
ncbi:MAG: hypothetical protein H7Y32_00345 [Chloroflexales bacterium]|nr:hypothetical protein [Chloroflexales bacterium]